MSPVKVGYKGWMSKSNLPKESWSNKPRLLSEENESVTQWPTGLSGSDFQSQANKNCHSIQEPTAAEFITARLEDLLSFTVMYLYLISISGVSLVFRSTIEVKKHVTGDSNEFSTP